MTTRPTDDQLNEAELFIFDRMEKARQSVFIHEVGDADVRRAAIVAHFAAALASLRSIQRGAK